MGFHFWNHDKFIGQSNLMDGSKVKVVFLQFVSYCLVPILFLQYVDRQISQLPYDNYIKDINHYERNGFSYTEYIQSFIDSVGNQENLS